MRFLGSKESWTILLKATGAKVRLLIWITLLCVAKLKKHDENLSNFLPVAAKCNLTFNEQKCTYSAESICLLGYRISEGNLSPDPDRVKPLLDMPIPKTMKELR